ncbi:MAG: hypothetical protein LBB40_03255 [Holophagales bacterium]|jgi:acyl carrier protein phosphodiesterase|nr:hypothetical protein [Holophagales bacterium]
MEKFLSEDEVAALLKSVTAPDTDQVRKIAELIDELAIVKKERREMKEKQDQAASVLLDVIQTLRSKTWSGA